MTLQVHGHRGARARLPENTLPAFEYAVALGVDALEMDLAVTRDGVLVVSHDPAMNPAFCDGPPGAPRLICEMTFAELRQWDCGARANPAFPLQQARPGTRVPAFTEVLDLAARGNFDLNVETKIFATRPHLTPPPGEFARMIHEAVSTRGLGPRLILQSFDFRTLAAMRTLDPTIRLSALFEAAEPDVVARSTDAGAHIISPHHSLVNPAFVAAAHRAGLQVLPWTANTEGEWRRLIDAGVDGIITDDPAALLQFLGR